MLSNLKSKKKASTPRAVTARSQVVKRNTVSATNRVLLALIFVLVRAA